ncbi:hypothetical protein [Streptomyces sp. Ac-502]|uniref:hypothetical protein n=1 Tax=Streptomyces sp. Ac-502 TaxID=3342801 RepID=UPI003862CA17
MTVNDPATPDFGANESVAIVARGPVAGVQLHAHMEFGPFALTHPLDTKVVIQLMFMFAEQSRQRPGEPLRVTPVTVLERLREMGVVSGNGARVVGRDAVYESFTRIAAKGYIRRLMARDERGRKTGVAYEFYDFPEYNPEIQEARRSGRFEQLFPQVSSTSGNAGSGNAGNNNGHNCTNKRSAQAGTTSGIAGYGDAGSGNADAALPQVSSTSGNAGNPHTPGGGGYLLPYPLTGDAREHPSPMEEGKPAAHQKTFRRRPGS